MEKTVAVSGGSGFIGRAIVEKLTGEGARVIVLCRNAERAKYLKTMGVVGQVTLVAGNALNDDDLETMIAPADAVINLIGIRRRRAAIWRTAGRASRPYRRIGRQARHRRCRSCVCHRRGRKLAKQICPQQGRG